VTLGVQTGELDDGTPVVAFVSGRPSHFATCPHASQWRRT
jgi:hypothetical protein